MFFSNKFRRCALAASTVLAAIQSLPAAAQVISVYTEQSKLIRAPRDVAVLGNDLLGDKVNLYTGGLEFIQTDVSLPGNSALPVSVGRRLTVGQDAIDGTLFGRWDLEIPRLHGVFSHSRGWVSSGSTPGNRCSAFGPPPAVTVSSGAVWSGKEYWHGSFLYVPGAGDQEMLARTAAYTTTPPTFSYPIVTRGN